MMKHVTNKAFYALALTGGLLFSCNNDPEIINDEEVKFGEGVYISNEGNTQTNTGSISYFDPTSREVTNNIFSQENDMDLGIYLQSIAGHDGKGFISVDNMNRLYVVNLDDFELEGIVEGLAKPQFFLGLNEAKGYVSQWGDGGFGGDIAVINLSNNTVSSNINVGKGPKKMLLNGNNLIVLNSGGFGNDNSISIINTQTDEVTKTLVVGDKPNSAVIDRNGALWVMCGGRYKSDFSGLETKGRLVKINTSDYTVESSYNFESETSQPSRLAINEAGDTFYYTYRGGVHSSGITDFSVGTPLINRGFYGFDFNKKDGLIYGTNAGDFASAGWVIRFTAAGVAQDSVRVGIIPSGFLFN